MREITENELEYVTREKTILEVYSKWCAPCRPVTAVLASLEEEYPMIDFCRIEVDKNPKISALYSIYSLPIVLGFNHGQLITQIIGAKDKNKFKEMIEVLVQN